MRTNIVIDDSLMAQAMKAGDFKTKKDAVEEGLRLLARRSAYQNLRALRGKLQWSLEGDWTQTTHQVQEARSPLYPPSRSAPGAPHS